MTAAELGTRWGKRDSLYRRRPGRVKEMPALTDEEETTIRDWRRLEIDELPADERSAAWGTLARWSPPIITHR